MALLKALRKIVSVFLLLGMGWAPVQASESLLNSTTLTREMLDLQKDLLRIDQKLEARLGDDRLVIYLDMGKVPELRLDSVEIAVDGQLLVSQTITPEEARGMLQGGMKKLYVGPLAPGAHQISATLDGLFDGAYHHAKTYPFVKSPGVNTIKVSIIDVGHKQSSKLIFLPEFSFRVE